LPRIVVVLESVPLSLFRWATGSTHEHRLINPQASQPGILSRNIAGCADNAPVYWHEEPDGRAFGQ